MDGVEFRSGLEKHSHACRRYKDKIMNKWVTVTKASELTGYTPDAIKSKIKRGDWVEGLMWKNAPDNRRLVNLVAFDSWVEGNINATLTSK